MTNKNKLTPEQDKQIKEWLKEPPSGDDLVQKAQKEIHKKDLKSGKHDDDHDLKKTVQQTIEGDGKNEVTENIP